VLADVGERPVYRVVELGPRRKGDPKTQVPNT
jgi:hypothetical protein